MSAPRWMPARSHMARSAATVENVCASWAEPNAATLNMCSSCRDVGPWPTRPLPGDLDDRLDLDWAAQRELRDPQRRSGVTPWLAQHLAADVRRTGRDDVLLTEAGNARDEHGDLHDPRDSVERAELVAEPPEQVEGALTRAAQARLNVDVVAEAPDREQLIPGESDLPGEDHRIAAPDERPDLRIRPGGGAEHGTDRIEAGGGPLKGRRHTSPPASAQSKRSSTASISR